MEFGGTFEQTQTLAGDVVARLTSLGLRQTPPNFTIFYTYLTGRYPDLIRAVDDLIAEKDTAPCVNCVSPPSQPHTIAASATADRTAVATKPL